MTDEENTEEKVELTPAEESPWYKFYLTTLMLDKKYEEPFGWHWFCAFKDLSDVNLASVQEKLPEEHPFKSKTPRPSFLTLELNDAVIWLKNALNITGDIKIKEIDFSGLKFKSVLFSVSVFPIKVFFRETHFLEKADFTLAFFFDDVDFNGTVFNDNAVFDLAIFNAKLRSSKAVFKHTVFFRRVEFVGGVNFGGAKFTSAVIFSDAIFFDEAFFDGIKTESHTEFINTEFKKRAPSMYDAVLYSGIKWDNDINLWPHPPKREDNETDEQHKKRITRNQSKYENLASQMKKLDKYHDEHFFYRQEMRCRRWLEENPFISFSYWLYETVSDYGYGIKQALLWWFLHIFLGAILIGATTKSVYNKNCDLAGNFYLDMIVSLANAHGVLFLKDGALKKCYMKFDALPVFNFIWGVQTIIGILLLFMLLLTLRIRFRLK